MSLASQLILAFQRIGAEFKTRNVKGAGVFPTGNTSYGSANADVTITLNGGLFNDSTGYYNLDGTGITIATAGIFVVTWAVDWAGGAAAGSRNSYLSVNGTDFAESNRYDTSGKESRVIGATIQRFNANDVIRLHVSSDTATTINGGNSFNTNLKMVRIGA